MSSFNLVSELPYWLVLCRHAGIGPKRFARLLNQTNTVSNYFNGETPRRELLAWCEEQGIKKFNPDWRGVEKDLRWATQAGCAIITWAHPEYPQMLREISAPPPVLFVQGDISALSQRQLAIIGSRTPTAEGKSNAYRFAYEAAGQGLVVTSGLALGVDGAAHEGALKGGGKTIAVLGNGLDQSYPAKHQALAAAITGQGALISEFAIGTPPLPAHFPQRNRIISGLSWGVLVIESALKSGSLITAQYALDQGREVFALPGSIHNALAKGCHALIRQGAAKCVDSLLHILEEMPPALPPVLAGIPVPALAAPTTPAPLLPALSPEENLVYESIGRRGITPLDEIVEKSGLTVEALSPMLLTLELNGRVLSTPGGYTRVPVGV